MHALVSIKTQLRVPNRQVSTISAIDMEKCLETTSIHSILLSKLATPSVCHSTKTTLPPHPAHIHPLPSRQLSFTPPPLRITSFTLWGWGSSAIKTVHQPSSSHDTDTVVTYLPLPTRHRNIHEPSGICDSLLCAALGRLLLLLWFYLFFGVALAASLYTAGYESMAVG